MTNYSRGASFERMVKADLERHGYFAMRSAGSHGIVDIVAIRHLEPWFVQVKLDGYMSPEERRELADLCANVCATPIMASKKKGGGIQYRRLLANDEWEGVKP